MTAISVFLTANKPVTTQKALPDSRYFRLLVPLSEFFAPMMSLFGLPRRSAYMWLVGNILGISYGSAVMVELEQRKIVS